MPHLPEEEGNGRERWLLGVAVATGVSIGLSGHLDFRTLIRRLCRSSLQVGQFGPAATLHTEDWLDEPEGTDQPRIANVCVVLEAP